MPRIRPRQELLQELERSITTRQAFYNACTLPLSLKLQFDHSDVMLMQDILSTRYLEERLPVPKAGNLHLAFEHEHNGDILRFRQMLRVDPRVFYTILDLIKDKAVFHNQSHNEQTPVQYQLAVALYRFGRFGNGASVSDIARCAGISEGSVLNFTTRVIIALLDLQHIAFRIPTMEEKQIEKEWVASQIGFHGEWSEGWLFYDGTTIVLASAPVWHEEAYYGHKQVYGFNAQLGIQGTNLRVVDLALGHTASAHDALAFQQTCAFKYPQLLFEGLEFCWGDSAYTLSSTCISVHRRPAALDPHKRMFDEQLSKMRIRSEHGMGALKQRFQSLNGLPISIQGPDDHIFAIEWIKCCVIIHNIIVDMGEPVEAVFADAHRYAQQQNPVAPIEAEPQNVLAMHLQRAQAGEEKRQRLIAELLRHR